MPPPRPAPETYLDVKLSAVSLGNGYLDVKLPAEGRADSDWLLHQIGPYIGPAREQRGGSVVALMEVEWDQVSSYGTAAIEATGEDDVVQITDLVEKPAPDDAPSNWIIIGRYVCDPAVFGVLEKTPPGRGGEIQLTDALKTLAGMDPADGGGVHGVLFRGRRYDTGNKVDYLRTLIQFAVERPDVAGEFVPWLRKYLDNLP